MYAESAAALGSGGWESLRDAAGGPPLTLETRVRPEWVGADGEMMQFRCLQVFGEAAEALFRAADQAGGRSGGTLRMIESHLTLHARARALEAIFVTTQVLGLDEARVHLFHRLARRGDERLIATAEQVYEHLGATEAAPSPMGEGVRARLGELHEAHACLPVPPEAGRRVVFAGH
ncbi:MAG TPA: thioesterase family protein [Steroidobacteraceae bacterium]|nr:thioesterase family protein [Steroidobacteraceae bacterium]